jgi:hypothetical protein
MVINGFLLILAVLTAVGVFVAESIDCPRRRTERLAKQKAGSLGIEISTPHVRSQQG